MSKTGWWCGMRVRNWLLAGVSRAACGSLVSGVVWRGLFGRWQLRRFGLVNNAAATGWIQKDAIAARSLRSSARRDRTPCRVRRPVLTLIDLEVVHPITKRTGGDAVPPDLHGQPPFGGSDAVLTPGLGFTNYEISIELRAESGGTSERDGLPSPCGMTCRVYLPMHGSEGLVPSDRKGLLLAGCRA